MCVLRGGLGRLTIQPRAPVVDEETGPGAQPRCFDSGESTAQPTSMPRFMAMVTGKPIMTPCPTYDNDGVNLYRSADHIQEVRSSPVSRTHHHIHCAARLVPNGRPRTSNNGKA
jgi:hypothetical protein